MLQFYTPLFSASLAPGMSRFQDVPNKIICVILEFVRLEDHEKLAGVSKHVYSISQPLLPEHRRLTRQYKSLRSP